MVVTGIFQSGDQALASPSVAADSGQIFEEKIAENETLVSMRAEDLRQALLLTELLSQAGAQNIEIDAQAG